MKKLIFLLQFIFLISLVSSLSVDSVVVDTVSPGEEGEIRINVDNDGTRDVQDVSFSLIFPNNSGIIPIGSSEAFVEEIEEDEDETFGFKFRVANNLPAGTYSLSYTINYEENNNKKEQKGTIGVVVSAEPEIDLVADIENGIVGQQGRINVRIINKGLADARFVNIFIDSEDVTFLSEKSEYIGTIDSDDFETSNFDVFFDERFISMQARVVYKDFNNKEVEILETLSLRAYSTQEAVEKGILNKSNASTYVGIVLLLLVIWFVYRFIRKRRKNKN